MSSTFVQSFKLTAQNLWKETFIQNCYPELAVYRKFSNFEKAVVLSKIFFFFKKAESQLQYVCNNYAKFQIDCSKTVGGVDYATFLEGTDGQMNRRQRDRGKALCPP